MKGTRPAGIKPQAVAFGKEKYQGRGELSEVQSGFLRGLEAINAPAVLREGAVRALSDAKRRGMMDILEKVESFEQRHKENFYGTISATKAIKDIRTLIDNLIKGDPSVGWY